MQLEEAIEILKLRNRVTKKQIQDGEIWLNVEEWEEEIQATETVLQALDNKIKESK